MIILTIISICLSLLLLIVPHPVRGQWGKNGCGPVGPAVVSNGNPLTYAAGYHGWYAGQQEDGKPCLYLYVNGSLAESKAQGCYGERCYVYDQATGRWSPKDTEMAPPPREITGQGPLPDWALNGVEWHNPSKAERTTVNGRETTKKQALQAIAGGPDLPDDSGLLRLTVIGSDADRKPVLDDLAKHPALAPLKDRLLITDYLPDAWQVRPGFVTSGKPTIYAQAPGGKVLLRLDAYPGPEQLAEAVRKADPTYDPAKDPNGKPPVAPGSNALLPIGIVAVGAGGLIALSRRKVS